MCDMSQLSEMWRAAGLVNRLIEKLSQSHLDGRRGGYVTFRDADGLEVFKVHVGEQSRDKQEDSYHFSSEKTERLHVHPKHLLSHQSRAPANKQYGGAIRLPSGLKMSISGLREADDTLVCMAVAYALGWIDDGLLSEMAEIMFDAVGQDRFPIVQVSDVACEQAFLARAA